MAGTWPEGTRAPGPRDTGSSAGRACQARPATRGRPRRMCGRGPQPAAITSETMIDLRRLRAEPDAVRAQLARRAIDLGPVERVLTLDEQQRRLAQQRDDLRGRVKALSQAVATARRA